MRKALSQVFGGLAIGAIILVLIFGAIWTGMKRFVEDDSRGVTGREWFVDSPKSLELTEISNDVWQWYDADGIKPRAISRVEWNEETISGRTEFGYFIYYKGLVVDPELERRILISKNSASHYSGLPAFASRQPEWWRPQFDATETVSLGVLESHDEIYFSFEDQQVFVYWMRRPYEGYVRKPEQNKPAIVSLITLRVG